MRIFCILAALIPAFPLMAEDNKKPNILFLLADDQAWSDYGFMGHPQIKTPAIDQLATNGLTFTRGYTPIPLCRPALASITTGLYAHQHRITGNDPKWKQAPDGPEKSKGGSRGELNAELVNFYKQSPNMMQALKEAGYLTLQTGKWWEGNPVTDGGFTHGMTHGDPKRGARHGDVGLKIGRETQQPIYDFIKEAGDKPWFVWYGVFLPHTPHNPPQELLEKYLAVCPSEAVARYWANCEWHDRAISELIGHLKKIGQYDNTVIIYTCDNGWIQDPNKGQQYDARSKQTIYEGGIRTPIFISWNGHIQPRMDNQHLASNIDIWPTIAALTGCSKPDNLTGINLIDQKSVEARDTIYGEDFIHDLTDRDNPTKDLEGRYIIEGDWKLIAPVMADKGPELYNLAKDPWEKQNLAATEPERVKHLSTKLDAWWKP